VGDGVEGRYSERKLCIHITRHGGAKPTCHSQVTEAAVTTTAMISPRASTANPRLRPGTFFPASLPVVAAGTWFAARID
jgi:hypothetical protein